MKRGRGSIFRNAPTVFIVSTDTRNRFGIVNAAAARENMLIAAESLGIASRWIGMVSILSASPSGIACAKELQLPDGYAPQGGITLGFQASDGPPPARRQNLVSYIP